jgi:PAS domain S-box-containing protein
LTPLPTLRLKTKLVLAITGLIFVVVTALSWLFLDQLLEQRIKQSYTGNEEVAHQILYSTGIALEGLRGKTIDTNNPSALRDAVATTLQQDRPLKALLESVIRYSPTVFDVSIADPQGRALISTDPMMYNQLLPQQPDYSELLNGGVLPLLRAVFGPPRVYVIALPVEMKSHPDQPFATIRVGIRTTFLKNTLAPWILPALTFTGISILGSLAIAAFLANLALQPIADISRRLDLLAEAEAGQAQEHVLVDEQGKRFTRQSPDTVDVVSTKIDRIGRRMRNVEEVFSALRDNLNQVMTNLQDGIMLFTQDSRAVLVSDSMERFLGTNRQNLYGAKISEIFKDNTLLDQTIIDAFEAGNPLVQAEVQTETGRLLEVSLDLIKDPAASNPRESLGALLTLHDTESVREIENELELSRRLAAIGRLTSGVGHEVKNPINAIVVHLELLRTKLDLAGSDERAVRHLDIIESEIQRLDRVVQTLVDFSRPVELQLRDQDLRSVVSSVLMLASAELETHNVHVVSDLPANPLMAKLDADLIKQAILNIVLNGAQAMEELGGGELTVHLREEGRMAVLSIVDQGSGIPEAIRDKIFDLYFTTKKEGSGIGLAMAYRIVQLHNGRIDVQSGRTIGTTFVLRIPLLSAAEVKLRGSLQSAKAEPASFSAYENRRL